VTFKQQTERHHASSEKQSALSEWRDDKRSHPAEIMTNAVSKTITMKVMGKK
jgi:hypothetical protein